MGRHDKSILRGAVLRRHVSPDLLDQIEVSMHLHVRGGTVGWPVLKWGAVSEVAEVAVFFAVRCEPASA